MALLDALPQEVEASLCELRSSSSAAPTDGRAVQSASASGNGDSPLSSPPAPRETEDIQPTTNGVQVDNPPPAAPIAFATDINTGGTFGTEWLVVENGHVYVFVPNGGAHAELRRAVPLQSIKEAKAEMFVGNGLLHVRTDAETVPLVRFSQAIAGEANAVARRINALSRGETPRWEQIEAKKKLCPRCKRVLPEDTDVCPGCVNKRAVMLRLFRFLRPYSLQAICSVLIIISLTLAELAPPWIAGRIVDTLTRAQRLGVTSMGPITFLVALLALTRLLFAALMYAQRRVNAFLGARVLMDIRIAIYHRFNQLSLGYYDKRTTGSVMSRITNDADNLWDFLTDGVPWLLSTVLTLVGTSLVLFKMDWQLALLLLTPAPFIYALNAWFMPRARRRWRHLWHRISKMYSTLNSTLNGMRVVKAFAQEERENERWRDRNRRVFEASYAANAMWATYWPALSLLMSLGAYIIWLFGGWKVLHNTMTIGMVTAFSGYLMQFYMPFQNFSRVMDWSTRSLTAAERVFEVLDTEPDIQDAKDAVPMPEIRGAVEFENVAFSYDKAKRVLEEFSLKVEPGEMIGLVGHSGAGKSTIINLLSRFYDVDEGCIKVDGVDIRQIKQTDFRRQFGIVLQEPFLFPGTIRENIAYARPDATVEEIMRAAKAANCHEFILKFPDGYDTQVGERGQRLSGGERQRISIARAILHNPRILILDEATASVDTETEKQIQEAINRLVQNRTTFAIAHRLSTLRHANRLVVMKEGKMVECGTHDELMEKDGVYANLVKIQTEVNQIRAV